MKKETLALLAIAGYFAYKFISKKQDKKLKNAGNLFKDLRIVELQTDSTEDAIKQTYYVANNKYGIDVSMDMASKIWSMYLRNTNKNPEAFDKSLREAGLLSSMAK